ncbi:amino acid adenylation domain-containing protein [Pyxidicoccus parkwayensis]|uniref:Amino acid adenylation domain-containing protein n=2 Tax=Pyxidicoccus parkwayensis TaxID=2813578 RepID=A0ABX7P5I0_9BACT|nr:amino acid adenylation domain-containing protein [Pyxidicoccus parkwaysis]
MTHAQESLWLLHKLAPQPAYNEPRAFRISGPLRVELLREALRLVAERHAALRTTFEETRDGLRAVVHAQVPDCTEVIDLRHLQEPAASQRAEALLDEHYRRPFSLDQGPLLRALVVQLPGGESLFGFTIHHLATDGWSFGVIIGELGAHYRALTLTGGPAALPPLASQYTDYAERSREAYERGELDETLAFWKRRLEDGPGLLTLPTDRPRPAVQTFNGATCSVTVPRSRLTPLVDLCRRECGSTEFLVLMSAYAALLWRYTGQDKVAVGTTLLNREDADSLDGVGCYVNTAALLFGLDENTTFRSLLARGTEDWAGVLAHQDAPFPKVLERLGVAHDPSHSPVFQTMMTALGKPKKLDLGKGFTCTPHSIRRVAAKFELLVFVSELEDEVELEVEFNTDLFDRSTVERMLSHYVHLLEQLASNLDTPVSRVSILPEPERRLLEAWNDTRVEVPRKTVIDAFEEQAAKTPDAIAVEFEDRTLTYAELHRLTNRVARALLAAQAPSVGFVGVYMERSIDMVVSLVSIVKAGLAYVPIDPEYPADRIRYMLEDSQVSLVLTQEHLVPALSSSSARPVTLAGLVHGREDDSDVERSLSFDSRAYMIYTSGSTGRPKGVINRHGSLFNRLYWMQSEYPLTGADRVLQKTPFSFDVSVWEFFWPLMYGARIVVARPGGHRDAEYLKQLIRDRHVTTLHFVPSMLSVFLEEEDLAACCGSLRQVFCSGEALPYKTVEDFYAKVSCGLHNLYGPTEAAIDVSYWPCTLDYPGKVVPIGKPIANTSLYVVDKQMQLQPIGVPGELCIGGVGLAERYHNRDDLTQKAFVADPFAREPGARMYRTGDLARYLADGQIEYLGRIDNQIKLRGFRIELGEIEAVVQGAPGVRKAAVILHQSASNKFLVAYVVADEVDSQKLREHLKTQLPEFMVPRLFISVPDIPTTANGKMDRKALPDPLTAVGADAPESGAAGSSLTPPSTKEEAVLLGIWREVLGVERLGVDSNFFRLGGDSILSIRIAARLRELGYPVGVREIFAHPTVRQLARHLTTTHQGEVAAAPAEPAFHLIDAAVRQQLPPSIEDAWPLTRLQSGMIYHSLMNPGSAVYHDIFSYDFRAPVNAKHLRGAVREVVGRHPQLRSRFELHQFDEPLQLVGGEVEVPLELVDVSTLSREAQDAELARWVEDEKRRDFDLETAPLLRCWVHVRSASEFTFTLSFHHVILDGWSVALVMDELRRVYASLLGGPPVVLEGEGAPYSMYVALERRAIDDPSHALFWRELLAHIPRPLLLGQPSGVGKQAPVPSSAERTVPAEMTSALRSLAGRLGLPIKSAFLALHLHALGEVTGRDDVVSGLVVNGRPEVSGGERCVGLFLNTLPVALRRSEGSWPARVARVFSLEQDTAPYRRLPLAEILRLTRHKELFDVLFNYTHFHVYQSEADGLVRIAGARYFEQTNFGAVVHAHLDSFTERMTLVVNYDAARVDGKLVERYLDSYLRAASSAAASTEAPVLTVAASPASPASGTTLEQQLREALAAVTRTADVGLDDNYLELGVDSISAIRFVARLKRLGIKLSLQDVFEHPTVRKLAARLKAARPADTVQGPAAPVEAASTLARHLPPGVADGYPATALQLDMIAESQADVAQAIYHDLFSYRFALPLNEALLRRVLRTLTDRHETLRTAFDVDASPTPMQWVHAAVTPHLEVLDLSRLREEEQSGVFDAWFERERATSFDVTRPQLMRTFAHRHGPASFTLTLSFHHSILDGWSLSLLIRELVSLYSAALQEVDAPVPGVVSSRYRDYVKAELESRQSEEARAFWRNELRGVEYTALPRPPGRGAMARWSETKVLLDRPRQEALMEMTRRAGVPVKFGLLSAHLAILGLLGKRTDVLTATFVNGRLEEEGSDEVLGLFLNFMPFRQSLEGLTWRRLLEETFASDIRRLPYRRHPLASIRRDLGQERLVETAFNYTQFKAYADVTRDGSASAGTGLVSGARWFEHTAFPLLVNAGYDLRQEQMILTLNANGQVLPQWSIEVLGALYDATLTRMLTREDSLVTQPSEEMTRLAAALKVSG